MTLLQIREKDLAEQELEALTTRILAAVRGRQTSGPRLRVLLNGPAHIAASAGADGVHLPGGADPQTIEQARSAFNRSATGGASPLISVSCHTIPQILEARTADLLLFGPVLEKRVHGHLLRPGLGLPALRAACAAASPTPVLALGGIGEADAVQCLDSGASGLAGIRLFHPAPSP